MCFFFTDVHSRTSCCWVMPAVLHPSIRGWNVACAFAQNVFFVFLFFFYFISRFFLFVTNGIGRCAQPQTAATSQHRISTVVVTFFFFSLSFVIHHQHFFTSTWVFFFFFFIFLLFFSFSSFVSLRFSFAPNSNTLKGSSIHILFPLLACLLEMIIILM